MRVVTTCIRRGSLKEYRRHYCHLQFETVYESNSWQEHNTLGHNKSRCCIGASGSFSCVDGDGFWFNDAESIDSLFALLVVETIDRQPSRWFRTLEQVSGVFFCYTEAVLIGFIQCTHIGNMRRSVCVISLSYSRSINGVKNIDLRRLVRHAFGIYAGGRIRVFARRDQDNEWKIDCIAFTTKSWLTQAKWKFLAWFWWG